MKARLVATQNLHPYERDSMYELLQTHFEGTQPEVFAADLAQKNWVVLLEDEQILKGFSTLLLYKTQFNGKIITIIYSGDTIVDPSAWTSSVLPRAWISAVQYLRQRYASGPLYWLLISSGYRTYRFLPTFWQQFYPRYDLPTPPTLAALIDFLCWNQFQHHYDEAAGVIRLSQPQALREGLRQIPVERLSDPHVAFFLQRNPGYVQGDELVCLTEITEANLTAAGRRMWNAEFRLAISPVLSEVEPDQPDEIGKCSDLLRCIPDLRMARASPAPFANLDLETCKSGMHHAD
jgi:hypothetical protein